MPSKWLRDHRKQEHEEHKKRIRNMKSLIDNRPPREMPMSRRNEIERERKRALIEMDNRLLLDRLAIAMQTKNIDNVLVEKPFISLMELQRKKELKKIMIANSRLLERIQCTIPSYDHVLWEKEAEHHVEILKNMTEFPELFVAPGTHQKGRDMAVVDAERAKAKADRKSKSNSNSPEKRVGTAGSGAQGQSRSGGLRTTSSQESMGAGMESPNSQPSQRSGFVPYSYFPEEQYAQYQRNLVLQQQQQQMQQQQGGGYFAGSPYGGGGYGQGSSSSAGGALSPEMLQQQQQQQLYAYHRQDLQQQQRQPFPQQGGVQLPPAVNTSLGGGAGGEGYGNHLYYGMQQQGVQGQQWQGHAQGQGQGGVQLPDIYQSHPGAGGGGPVRMF